MKRPDLKGRVAVKFVIGGRGAVMRAVLSSSSLGDPQVEGCIVRTVERFVFPLPEDSGIVIVTYPFTLKAS